MPNALTLHTRARWAFGAGGLQSLVGSILSVLLLTRCVPPVDQELEPDDRESSPNTTVFEYRVSLVESGQALADGCTALASNQFQGRLAENLQATIPLGVEYRVDVRMTYVAGTSGLALPDGVARYCTMEDRRPIALHYPASCVVSEDPTLHELTAKSIMDEEGNLVSEPSYGPFTYEKPATERYQLVSRQAGRVVLDLSAGPCAPTVENYPHELFALATVLEEESQ